MGTGVGEMMFYALATQVATNMMAPSPSAPKMPTLQAAPVVETPDPLAQDEARKKSLLEQMQRSGRASTILTDDVSSGKLGG